MKVLDWILLRCPACERLVKFREDCGAIYLRCPECATFLEVPRADEEAAPDVIRSARDVPAAIRAGGGRVLPGKRPGAARRKEEQAAVAAAEAAPAADAPLPRENRLAHDNPLSDVDFGDWDEPATIHLHETEFSAPLRRTDGAADDEGLTEPLPVPQRVSRYPRLDEWDRAPGAEESVSSGKAASEHRFSRLLIRLGILLAVVAFAGFAILAIIDWTGDQKGAHSADPFASPPVPSFVTDAPEDGSLITPTGENDQPLIPYADVSDAVENFMEAPDVDQLLATIRDRERLEPVVRKYYEDRPYHPPGLREMSSENGLAQSDNFILVQAETNDFEVRSLAVEAEPDGDLKVDWESFVGYSEMPWTDLLLQRPVEPVLVRAVIAADTYYNYEFSDPEKFACYRMENAEGDVQIFGYVERGSEVERLLDLALPREKAKKTVLATLRIRYPEEAEISNQVIITDLVTMGWIFRRDRATSEIIPVLPRPASPAVLPEEGEEGLPSLLDSDMSLGDLPAEEP